MSTRDLASIFKPSKHSQASSCTSYHKSMAKVSINYGSIQTHVESGDIKRNQIQEVGAYPISNKARTPQFINSATQKREQIISLLKSGKTPTYIGIQTITIFPHQGNQLRNEIQQKSKCLHSRSSSEFQFFTRTQPTSTNPTKDRCEQIVDSRKAQLF